MPSIGFIISSGVREVDTNTWCNISFFLWVGVSTKENIKAVRQGKSKKYLIENVLIFNVETYSS